MSKTRTHYQCTACAAVSTKWSGQCADCGDWNTLEETVAQTSTAKSKANAARFGGYAGGSGITNASDVELVADARTSTGLSELDRVLGGGLVSGSVTLLGGDPGIGKSTLLYKVSRT